jgi:hypothetical protein
MKRIVEKFYCDVCHAEAVTQEVNYPVIFLSEQTEGRPVKPYISQERLDICDACAQRMLMLEGYGAQGNNVFEFRKRDDRKESGDA